LENVLEFDTTVALVTGANRGIGRALVEGLLERGTKRVYATARDLTALEAVAPLDRDRVVSLQLDITDPRSIGAAADEARDVNLLVNNAGVLTIGDLLGGDLGRIEEEMRVNYFGTLGMVRAFVPILEANAGGTIVNLVTLVALASLSSMGGYSASKAATFSMTQALRAQLGTRGIKVHGVFPGAVDTDMIRVIDMPKTSPGDVARAILDGVSAGIEDIFPDPMSQNLGATWLHDPKALERQLATF
jgi:NAD(P)-dependent dehydrogenase (short-subunit alcohol dehydrogenase family)